MPIKRLWWPMATLLCWWLGSGWGHAAPMAAPALQLTPAEQAYVQQHGTVHMCVDPDWAPFERLDPQGQHIGIAADLVQLVAQRTGLTIHPLVLPTWADSLAASRAGRCQIMSFLNQTPERDAWLNFTAPIFSDPNVLITREEHPYIADLKTLTNRTVALPVGTMVEERIRNDFPLLTVLTTPSEREAVEMVSNRQADLTIRSLIVAAYTIKQQGLFNLKISGQIPEYTNQLRIGVLKTEPVLLGLLDKAVATITPQEQEAISNRHVTIQIHQKVDYKLVWQVLAAAGVLLLLGAFWHYKVRQLDKQRTALAQAEVEQTLQAQRNQSQLVALLSHEVRTALSIIDSSAGSLRLLLQPQDQPCLLRVERIHAGVKRLQNLTDQFLTKDRLESGALRPHLMDLDAVAACTEAVAYLDEPQRIAIHHQGDTHLRADPDLLQVALRNLLVNALRYTPPNSPIMVDVVGEDAQITIRVSDQGNGVPAEEQELIFSSYVRGTQGCGKPGSGLGLHLVKRVVQLHAGRVFLDTTYLQGACFAIVLPRHPATTELSCRTGVCATNGDQSTKLSA